jgi:hypothetical protein
MSTPTIPKRFPQLAVLLILFTFTRVALSQPVMIGKNCNLSDLGASESRGFLTFDQELRDAFRTQDAARVAKLVKFPLIVYSNGGSIYLNSATSVTFGNVSFKVIFSPAIRRAVRNQNPQTIWCDERGIMYGSGVRVISTRRGNAIEYAIEAIYLPSDSKPQEVKFACETKKRRVIVDIGTDGEPRYRVWDKPHILTEKPDLELSDGRVDCEGTNPCTYCYWTFANETAEYVISQQSKCYEDTHPPPKGAKGTVDVSVSGKESSSWCF